MSGHQIAQQKNKQDKTVYANRKKLNRSNMQGADRLLYNRVNHKPKRP